LVRPAQANRHLVMQRARWAVSRAGATGLAASVQQRSSGAGDDGRVGAAPAHAPDEPRLNLPASPHAAGTQDALVQIDPQEGVAIAVDRMAWGRGLLRQPGPVVL